MQYVEAVEVFPAARWNELSLFLGGGITNCANWQNEMCQMLKDTNLTILNPRRKNFPMDDPNAANEQIIWEFNHMEVAKAIMFWFSSETVCPITLFEYGKWIGRNKRLFVGCHPDYSRLIDVKVQTRLARPDQKVHTDLKSLAEEIIQWQGEYENIKK
jgi:hypothetical protein